MHRRDTTHTHTHAHTPFLETSDCSLMSSIIFAVSTSFSQGTDGDGTPRALVSERRSGDAVAPPCDAGAMQSMCSC